MSNIDVTVMKVKVENFYFLEKYTKKVMATFELLEILI
jgi:hypothetical protein